MVWLRSTNLNGIKRADGHLPPMYHATDGIQHTYFEVQDTRTVRSYLMQTMYYNADSRYIHPDIEVQEARIAQNTTPNKLVFILLLSVGNLRGRTQLLWRRIIPLHSWPQGKEQLRTPHTLLKNIPLIKTLSTKINMVVLSQKTVASQFQHITCHYLYINDTHKPTTPARRQH